MNVNTSMRNVQDGQEKLQVPNRSQLSWTSRSWTSKVLYSHFCLQQPCFGRCVSCPHLITSVLGPWHLDADRPGHKCSWPYMRCWCPGSSRDEEIVSEALLGIQPAFREQGFTTCGWAFFSRWIKCRRTDLPVENSLDLLHQSWCGKAQVKSLM